MKYLFLDTNILLDYLAQRQPFFMDAEQIFNLADEGKVNIYGSSLSFSTIFYVLRKLQTQTQLFQTLNDLTQSMTITSVDEKVVIDALASGFKDLEDAIQYFSATYFGCIEAIITRNPKDFPNPQIPVFSPSEFLSMFQKN